MKIGIVLASVPGYSETFFRSKIKGLEEKGHSVTLYAQNRRGVRVDGAHVVQPFIKSDESFIMNYISATKAVFYALFCIPIRSFRFIKYERSDGRSLKTAFKHLMLNARLLGQDLDWVHFGFATMALGRENVGRTIGARQAVSFRGFDISIYPLKNPGCYSLLWKRIDKVHTISTDLLNLARTKQGLPKSIKVVRITPAIAPLKFHCGKRSGALHPKLKILSVGRLHWKKGYEYAMECFEILRDRGVDFEAVIVGEGVDYERIAYSVYQRKMTDIVTLAGRKDHDDVAKMMCQADIYIQPSVQEGFCNSVLEAQCSGLMCVVTNAEGLAENVVHERTGFVVPVRNPKAMADAIVNIKNMNDQERLLMIKTAYNRIVKEFDVENQKEMFNQFYLT